MNTNRFLITLLALTGIMAACSKTSTPDPTTDFFPPVQVNLRINMSLAQYSALNVQGGWVYEPGGNKGIIIYHTATDAYVAYDRTCPYNPKDSCAFVSVDSNGTRFMCGQYNPYWKPCCGSIFVVESGAPTYGPARAPLRAYQVRQDGYTLYITN